MKIKIPFVFIIVLAAMVASTSAFASRDKHKVEKLSSKHRNLFVFKTQKELVGAQVEVFYSNGDVVTRQKLQKKKMIIDFCDAKFGEYTIRVTKGDSIEEFQYIKKK